MLRKLTAAALLAVVAHAEEAVVSPEGTVEQAEPVATEAEPAAATEEAAPAEGEAAPAEGEAAPAETAEAAEGEAAEATEGEKKEVDDGLGPDAADDDLSEFDPPPEEDLQNKITTLLGLLENKNVDPKTKEQLQTLMGQLQGLGMDSEGLMNALGGGKGADAKTAQKNQVTAESLMTACSVLSAQYYGSSRSSTIDQLRAIGEADNLKELMDKGKAAEMLPLIAACTEELTQEELTNFNRGLKSKKKLKVMPERVIEAAKEFASNSTKLAEFDPELFGTLQKRMEVVVETLEQTAAAKKINTPLPSAVNMALILGFFGAFVLLVLKFFSMQRSLAAEKPAEKVQSAKSLKQEQKKMMELAKKRGA